MKFDLTSAAAIPTLPLNDRAPVPPCTLTQTTDASATCLPLEPSCPSTVARVSHSLDELERLAELLAVDDGYEPADRDFVLPKTFKLSVIIPVFNEVRTIERVL